MSDVQMLWTPVQAAKILGCSRSFIYSEISTGKLGSVSMGRCRRITTPQLDEYIASLPRGM